MIEYPDVAVPSATDDRLALMLLEAERSRLTRLIVELEDEAPMDEPQSDSVGDLAPVGQHQADHGSETYEREQELGLLQEFREELREIEQALSRLGDGSYGRCTRCREPIARRSARSRAGDPLLRGLSGSPRRGGNLLDG